MNYIACSSRSSASFQPRCFNRKATILASRKPNSIFSQRLISLETTNLDKRRKHLWYQSKLRGMLENDLLLGTFAQKHLPTMNLQLLDQYEELLQQPDVDIFKWLTGKQEVPSKFNTDIFKMLQKHLESNPLDYRGFPKSD